MLARIVTYNQSERGADSQAAATAQVLMRYFRVHRRLMLGEMIASLRRRLRQNSFDKSGFGPAALTRVTLAAGQDTGMIRKHVFHLKLQVD